MEDTAAAAPPTSQVARPFAWLQAASRQLSDVWSKPPSGGQVSSVPTEQEDAVGAGCEVMDVEELLPFGGEASSSSAPAGLPEPEAEATPHTERAISPMRTVPHIIPDVPLEAGPLQDLAEETGALTPQPLPDIQTPPQSPRMEEHAVDDAQVAVEPQAGHAVAAGSPPIVLDAPWRIDFDKQTAVPQDWPRVSQACGQPRATAWQCAHMQTLKIEESNGAGKVWKRWVQKVEDIAGRHVYEAFSETKAQLFSVIKGSNRHRGGSDVHAALALAGSDVADHEATMRQVDCIVRAELPHACVASVAPESFRSLAVVTRHICEQLMGGSRTGSISKVGTEVVAEEGEWPEDVDPRLLQKAGLGGCLDWYRERQARGVAEGVVLLIERVEAIPKDLLRDSLTALGNAFCDEGIPFFVILGVQHAPQDCFDLFEGEPLVNMHFLGAACLFDSRKIATDLFEWLLEDSMSMLVLPPNILDWLRRGRFEYGRRSISHIMQSLALLCFHFFQESLFGALCVPLDGVVAPGSELDKEGLEAAWVAIFQERLAKAPEVTSHLVTMWAPWREDETEEQNVEALRAEVAQAAAQAACWRHRLLASFGVWDALCCAAQPMTRHEARLRRLCRLFEELWPKESDYDPASLAVAFQKEQTKSHNFVDLCITRLEKQSELLSDKEVLRLLEDLLEASISLDDALKTQLIELSMQELEGDALRTGIQDWLHRVKSLYWFPLSDGARIVFREVFTAKCRDGLHLKVEASLAEGKTGFAVETLLQPLATGVGSKEKDTPPGDLTVLYRLIECSSSRSIEAADLWKTFCDCMGSPVSADGKPAQADLKHRFGYGILTLHAMGLLSPQAGGRADSGTSLAGWRLRKRHFGRVWLKAKESLDVDTISALCAASPSVAEFQLALRADDASPEKKPLPAWAQRWLPSARGDGELPSLLKRTAPARPTGFDPSAKRAKGADKSRARIFFA
jgi:hypothetical protein